MFNIFGKDTKKKFSDNNKYSEVFDIINNSDITFETTDNEHFTGYVGDKLYISFSFTKAWGWDNEKDKINRFLFLYVITHDNPESNKLIDNTQELFFSDEYMDSLIELVEEKINKFRKKSIIKMDKDRDDKIMKILKK